MNDTSTVANATGSGSDGQVADVGSLDGDHARVLAQRPRQLAVTHIHCIHAHRPALEQTIGETPRRSPDVGADPAGRIHAERIQRGGQLQPAPADVGQAGLDAQLGILGHELPRLVQHLIALPYLAGQDQTLRLGAALGQAAGQHQLIETHLV